MGRPKNSTDKKKRKVRRILNSAEERGIVEDFNDGLSKPEIMVKYNISKNCLRDTLRKRNVKPKITLEIIKNFESLNLSNKEKISGIYGIYLVKKVDNINFQNPKEASEYQCPKIYVGSSVDIISRVSSHLNDLNKNKHYNKTLQQDFNTNLFNTELILLEKDVAEEKLLDIEADYLNTWNFNSYYNTWKPCNTEDVIPFLKKAISLETYAKNYSISKTNFYQGTPCKESNKVHCKSGYSQIQVKLNGEIKYFTKHRIAYWEHYGVYVPLVRHLCDNPACYNPEHLMDGSHRQNILDRRGDFPELFEKKWLEFGADVELLSEFFKDKWQQNQEYRGTKVSYSVFYWEKKLGLREKYPEVLDKNKDRRFSISCRTKKKNPKVKVKKPKSFYDTIMENAEKVECRWTISNNFATFVNATYLRFSDQEIFDMLKDRYKSLTHPIQIYNTRCYLGLHRNPSEEETFNRFLMATGSMGVV